MLPVEFDCYGITAVVAHLSTVLFILSMARRMYNKAEISHPVIALAFQELVLICFCQLVGLGFLISTMVSHDPFIYGVFLGIGSLAENKNQMTWLCITILR